MNNVQETMNNCHPHLEGGIGQQPTTIFPMKDGHVSK